MNIQELKDYIINQPEYSIKKDTHPCTEDSGYLFIDTRHCKIDFNKEINSEWKTNPGLVIRYRKNNYPFRNFDIEYLDEEELPEDLNIGLSLVNETEEIFNNSIIDFLPSHYEAELNQIVKNHKEGVYTNKVTDFVLPFIPVELRESFTAVKNIKKIKSRGAYSLSLYKFNNISTCEDIADDLISETLRFAQNLFGSHDAIGGFYYGYVDDLGICDIGQSRKSKQLSIYSSHIDFFRSNNVDIGFFENHFKFVAKGER